MQKNVTIRAATCKSLNHLWQFQRSVGANRPVDLTPFAPYDADIQVNAIGHKDRRTLGFSFDEYRGTVLDPHSLRYADTLEAYPRVEAWVEKCRA